MGRNGSFCRALQISIPGIPPSSFASGRATQTGRVGLGWLGERLGGWVLAWVLAYQMK